MANQYPNKQAALKHAKEIKYPASTVVKDKVTGKYNIAPLGMGQKGKEVYTALRREGTPKPKAAAIARVADKKAKR